MNAQLSLVDGGRKDPALAARDWIADNPAGWDMALGFARQFVSRGRHFGMKLIAERVRFECALTGVPYKLDNRIVSHLARHLLAEIPEADRYMETRDGATVRRVERGKA